MAHFLESSVGGQNLSADEAEATAGDLFAELVVFCIESLFVEPAKNKKLLAVEHHEHSGAEGLEETRKPLRGVIGGIEKLVATLAFAAPDIGCEAVQLLALHLFNTAADKSVIGQLDIGIKKKHVWRNRAMSAGV